LISAGLVVAGTDPADGDTRLLRLTYLAPALDRIHTPGLTV
jgi:hypothetical protein